MHEYDVHTAPKQRLGLRVAELRAANGKSQREFASMIELDRVTLNRIESGTANPTLETLSRIARGFDIEVEALFENSQRGGSL